MGGRGSSSGIQSRKWTSETSAVGHDGKTIDLTNSPLRYNEDDKSVSGAVRNAIEAFEKSRVKNKIEYGEIVDSNGNIIETRRGGNDSVRIGVASLNRGEVYSHNHPRSGENGKIGGTFSTQDIKVFADHNVRVFRAAAAEGTYSIAKGRNFNGSGLKTYFKGVEQRAQADHLARLSTYRQTYHAVEKNFYANKATTKDLDAAYRVYQSQRNQSFNKMLVDLHEGLIKGAKQYGYSYTLERRKN